MPNLFDIVLKFRHTFNSEYLLGESISIPIVAHLRVFRIEYLVILVKVDGEDVITPSILVIIDLNQIPGLVSNVPGTSVSTKSARRKPRVHLAEANHLTNPF